MTHQLDSPVIVAFEYITFVFEYRYELTFLPAFWDTICHYSLPYVNSSGFSSATTIMIIIASIGKSSGQQALILPTFDRIPVSLSQCHLPMVSVLNCTGTVGSSSPLSFSTFSRVSNDSFHLALISSSSVRIVPLLSLM